MTFTTDGAVTGWIDFNLLTKNAYVDGTPDVYGYIGLAGYYISRAYLSFDTSTLPANCTVTSATLTFNYTILPAGPTLPSAWVHDLYFGDDQIGAALDVGDWNFGGAKKDGNLTPINGEVIYFIAKPVAVINKVGKTDVEIRDNSLASGAGGWNSWFYGTGGRGVVLTVNYNLPRIYNANIKNAKIYNA